MSATKKKYLHSHAANSRHFCLFLASDVDVRIFINGLLIGFGSLACKQAEMNAFIDRMLAVMPAVMEQKGRHMVVAKIDNLVPNTGDDKDVKPYVEGGTYFIYYGEGTKEMAEAIFGASLRDGVCYTTENLSRKQIVPRMIEVLNK